MIYRAIVAGCLLILAGRAIEQSYEEGILGDLTSGSYRLIGFECGEAKETILAMEEDEFPRCSRIESLERRKLGR